MIQLEWYYFAGVIFLWMVAGAALAKTTFRPNSAMADSRLRAKNSDLANQVEELRAARPYMPEEQKAISAIRAAHDALLATQNKIAMWLRENKKEEIARGDHKGKDLADVVIMYMGGNK